MPGAGHPSGERSEGADPHLETVGTIHRPCPGQGEVASSRNGFKGDQWRELQARNKTLRELYGSSASNSSRFSRSREKIPRRSLLWGQMWGQNLQWTPEIKAG